MKQKWYCISFLATTNQGIHFTPDNEYIVAETDEEAIKKAQEIAKEGKYYADEGQVSLEVTQIDEVDDTKETFPSVRTIYY